MKATKRRDARQLGLCRGHEVQLNKFARKNGLTWPPPGRILRLVGVRQYRRGERLVSDRQADGT